MSFEIEHFWNASLAVQIHVVTALVALVLGLIMFSRKKGGRAHRNLGKAWVVVMALVALSSFFIHQLRVWGLFSPIHLLSVFTLASLAWAIFMIRKRNVRAHEMTMKGLFMGGLVVAGALTFSRDLLMHRIFLSGGAGDIMPSLNSLPGGPVAIAFSGALFAGLLVMVWSLLGRKSA